MSFFEFPVLFGKKAGQLQEMLVGKFDLLLAEQQKTNELLLLILGRFS